VTARRAVGLFAAYRLMQLVLPEMRERRRGAVVNISSLGAYSPVPRTTTYAATKSFVIAFSEAIAVELEGTGVSVLCICPGFTRTEFQDKMQFDAGFVPAFAWMTSQEVADETVAAVGKQTVLVNGFMNRVTAMALRFLPRSLIAKGTTRLTSRPA